MPWESGFHWIAHYENGSTDQRQGATYADIDRSRLEAFGLYNGERVLILIDFRDDVKGHPELGPKRLIWRIRHQQRSDGTHSVVHLVGWQRQVGTHNIQSICYVNELGEIVLGGQWLEDKPLMYPVVPLECETDLVI